MEKLKNELRDEIEKLNKETKMDVNLSSSFLSSLNSVYPFNNFEFVMCHLIAHKIISLERYLEIRKSYLLRNKYLYFFEMAPRTFGETHIQEYLHNLVPELQKPSKELDPDYSGQYDFWYDGLRIEVKASRAVKREGGRTLLLKALPKNSQEGFDMNFQQLKPACCDVFVWIAVWRDAMSYWVLSSNDVKTNRYYSNSQHRGNDGEGQLWLKETNIREFDCYEVSEKDILGKIIEKGQ